MSANCRMVRKCPTFACVLNGVYGIFILNFKCYDDACFQLRHASDDDCQCDFVNYRCVI